MVARLWSWKHRSNRPALIAALVVAVCAWPAIGLADKPAPAPAESTAAEEFFETQIRPLLLAHCVECHGGKKEESGLRLDSRQNVLKGNEAGPVVLLKKPEKSTLLRAVRHEGDITMPPNGKLRDDQIAALDTWIRLGVPWPRAPATQIRSIPPRRPLKKPKRIGPFNRSACLTCRL